MLGGRNVREDPSASRRIFAFDDSIIEEYEIRYIQNQLSYLYGNCLCPVLSNQNV